MMYGYRSIVADYEAFHRALRANKPDCAGYIPNSWGLRLPLKPLSEKKKHYWFWSSEANKGKTTFLKAIQSQYRAAFYAFTEVYQNMNQNIQFLLLDEMSHGGKLSVTDLNQMCDGTYSYPIKGGSP